MSSEPSGFALSFMEKFSEVLSSEGFVVDAMEDAAVFIKAIIAPFSAVEPLSPQKQSEAVHRIGPIVYPQWDAWVESKREAGTLLPLMFERELLGRVVETIREEFP